MKKIELLAPARNYTFGADAINCGADAVYIGAEEFGARQAAANTLHDVEKLAAYAHKYRAKVYGAVNTILTDQELERAGKLIHKLWNAGVDAVIIQDMGLLELDLPPIALIASTQTNNTGPEKIKFLEKAGFQRVILARELSLAQIKEISAASKIELEFFAHGALCVSYSGQCYLSYYMGGRSGNRGECAQPCRKLYSLKDAKGTVIAKNKHLLSLKDLSLSTRLGDLLEAGITSFKIEGRLKDRDYVKNVVSYYRTELDKALKTRKFTKTSAGKPFIDFKPDLNKTFNRGYTGYLLDGANDDIASPDTPKFVGEAIGKAVNVDTKFFRLASGSLHNGDGISFFDSRGVLCGTHVNTVVNGKVMPVSTRGLYDGAIVYRNLDREFARELERQEPKRRLGVKLSFTETLEGFALKGVDEDNFEAEVTRMPGKTKADKPEAALETISRQLSKLGETDFYPLAVDVKLSAPYFIPVSVLNEMRRELLAKLESVRSVAYKRLELPFEKTTHKYPLKELDFTANILNSKAEAFYKRHGVKKIERAAEFGAEINNRPLMTMKLCLRRRMNLCPKTNSASKTPAEPLYLEDEEGRLFRLDFDCASCQMLLSRKA